MKLPMIEWMIRRAKKADQVRERDIDASVSLSLSPSLCEMLTEVQQDQVAGNNTQKIIF